MILLAEYDPFGEVTYRLFICFLNIVFGVGMFYAVCFVLEKVGGLFKRRERNRKPAESPPAQVKQDEPYHFVCGTPFIQARREQERLEANNTHGWKDKTGHILTNEEVELFRKCYFLYMTPVVHKMFDDDWDIKNDFEYIFGRSTFLKKPYEEREFEIHFYYAMMMPIVQSMIPKYFVADRELTVNDLYTIADDILGEQDHDFEWLERVYGIRWKR